MIKESFHYYIKGEI